MLPSDQASASGKTGWSRWLPRRHFSLGVVFGTGLGLLMLVSMGSMLGLSFDAAVENTTQLLQDKARLVLEASEERVVNYFEPVEHTGRYMRNMIEAGIVPIDNREETAVALQASLAGADQIYGIALLYDDLNVLLVGRSAHGAKFENWANRPDVLAQIKLLRDMPSSGWLPPMWTNEYSHTLLAYHLPLQKDGKQLGTLVLVVTVSDLSEDISSVAYANTVPFILFGREHVLAHPLLAHGVPTGSEDKPLPTVQDLGDPVLAKIWDRQRKPLTILLSQGSSGHVVTVEDGDQIFIYRTIERYGSTPWIIGLHVSGSEGVIEVTRLVNLGILSVALLLVTVLIAFFIGRAMGRPLMTLAGAAEKVQSLDLASVPTLPSSNFRELDIAARAFNTMVATLRWFEVYMPKALVHRLMSNQEDATRPQKREVSVMFTDIAGFTQRTALLGAEATAAFLDEHFRLVGECIDATGGTIDKYIGDSVMAFWGAPGTQKDHARRAAQAALMIGERINAYNRRNPFEPLQVRIGIGSGDVVVGNIGAPGRVNYTVIGEVVNLAQRLEQLGKACAPDDGICILMTEETARQLDDSFELTPISDQKIRGLQDAVTVYRLTCPDEHVSAGKADDVNEEPAGVEKQDLPLDKAVLPGLET